MLLCSIPYSLETQRMHMKFRKEINHHQQQITINKIIWRYFILLLHIFLFLLSGFRKHTSKLFAIIKWMVFYMHVEKVLVNCYFLIVCTLKTLLLHNEKFEFTTIFRIKFTIFQLSARIILIKVKLHISPHMYIFIC